MKKMEIKSYVFIGIIIIFVIGGLFLFNKYSVNIDEATFDPNSFCNNSLSVYKCQLDNQEIYSVNSGAVDSSTSYYFLNGTLVAGCGGMPLPNGESYQSSAFCEEISNCSDKPFIICEQ